MNKISPLSFARGYNNTPRMGVLILSRIVFFTLVVLCAQTIVFVWGGLTGCGSTTTIIQNIQGGSGSDTAPTRPFVVIGFQSSSSSKFNALVNTQPSSQIAPATGKKFHTKEVVLQYPRMDTNTAQSVRPSLGGPLQ